MPEGIATRKTPRLERDDEGAKDVEVSPGGALQSR
jgi:hypothetical protein